MYLSRFSIVQTMPLRFIGSENWKPGTSSALGADDSRLHRADAVHAFLGRMAGQAFRVGLLAFGDCPAHADTYAPGLLRYWFSIVSAVKYASAPTGSVGLQTCDARVESGCSFFLQSKVMRISGWPDGLR